MGINLRLITKEDKLNYWKAGFEFPDDEMIYYTGTTAEITKDGVDKFVDRVVEDEARFHFLIFLDEEIIGETSLMDVDEESRSCGFRIALFDKKYFGQGIGLQATKETLRYAFEKLSLHRVSLEVFDYNPRARRMYEKVGFKEEGCLRDGLYINGCYHNIYVMGILEDEFIEL